MVKHAEPRKSNTGDLNAPIYKAQLLAEDFEIIKGINSYQVFNIGGEWQNVDHSLTKGALLPRLRFEPWTI